MNLKNIYTSVACNRTTESCDWGANGLITFGARNACVILDPKFQNSSAKIIHTYVQHEKRVNIVRWLRNSTKSHETHFFSGGDDGLAIFWNIENKDEPTFIVLRGHESGIKAIDGIKHTNDTWLLTTAAADSSVKLWSCDGKKNVACIQTILLKSRFCFSIRLTSLPTTESVLLAFSSDDETISLWVQNVDDEFDDGGQVFRAVHKLDGHEDWVRGLDFTTDGNDLLLASCSQDSFIRLWRISPRTECDMLENAVDILKFLHEQTDEIRIEEKMVDLGKNSWFAISLESVLYGHEGWVYGVHWNKSKEQGLRLLSASMDKTLIVWELTTEGVWMEKVRLGEVGGNSLGFFGGKFSNDGRSLMGHSYQGAFHIWNQSEKNVDLWIPNITVGGHFKEVRDISWEPKGEFLISVSFDQTTRIHAPWRRKEKNDEVTWHEIARPQVHGYDMQAVAILSRYKFASGGEEKIVRVFQSPINFIESFRRIVGPIDFNEDEYSLKECLPECASVPSLGLSNKAVFNAEESINEERTVRSENPQVFFEPVTIETPPQEETLMQNTLWPETQKLYGHGFDVFALTASSDGLILASACRATNVEHAQILLWDTITWKQMQKLRFHQLTITQMRFSSCGRYLLSVSRDRRWALFEKQQAASNSVSFKLNAYTDKTNGIHARIIWSCDWSHDCKFFITSSRDGKVVAWTQNETNLTDNSSLNGWHAQDLLEIKNSSITAVTFAPKLFNKNSYIVALGCESGIIQIYQFDGKWGLLINNNILFHHMIVRRLQFSPNKNLLENQLMLSSCGDDCFVKICEITL